MNNHNQWQIDAYARVKNQQQYAPTGPEKCFKWSI